MSDLNEKKRKADDGGAKNDGKELFSKVIADLNESLEGLCDALDDVEVMQCSQTLHLLTGDDFDEEKRDADVAESVWADQTLAKMADRATNLAKELSAHGFDPYSGASFLYFGYGPAQAFAAIVPDAFDSFAAQLEAIFGEAAESASGRSGDGVLDQWLKRASGEEYDEGDDAENTTQKKIFETHFAPLAKDFFGNATVRLFEISHASDYNLDFLYKAQGKRVAGLAMLRMF